MKPNGKFRGKCGGDKAKELFDFKGACGEH